MPVVRNMLDFEDSDDDLSGGDNEDEDYNPFDMVDFEDDSPDEDGMSVSDISPPTQVKSKTKTNKTKTPKTTQLGRPTPESQPQAFHPVGNISSTTFRCMVPVTEPFGTGPAKCYVMQGMRALAACPPLNVVLA